MYRARSMAKMDCKRVVKRIPAFIQDELSIRELEAFLQHIDRCKECQEELTIQLLVTEGLVSLEAGDDFDIKQEMDQKMQLARRQILWSRQMDWLTIGIGIVSLCIAILLIVWLVV